MTFRHDFDPTSLREYDIRGIVGRTLSVDDAFAIGRCFGSIVARAGGKTTAIGYDGRLSSPALAEALSKTGDENGARENYTHARDLAQSLPSGPERDDWLHDAEEGLRHR